MAVRIRKYGEIVCAAIHPMQDGDTYLDDGVHYYLSVVHKVLVTEPWENHGKRGKWWWKGAVPRGIKIDRFYLEEDDGVQKEMP